MVDKQLLSKPRKLEKFLLKNPLPAVKGPSGGLYIVDHHHLSSALVQLGIEHAYVDVIKDWSALQQEAFWQAMVDAHYLWPHDERGQRVDWHDLVARLPQDVTGLKDDPFRSLAAIVRKAGGYNKVWVPFSEFQWANYLREALPSAQHDPAAGPTVAAALALAHGDGSRHLPGHHQG